MTNELSADEAADLVGKSAKYFRTKLREHRVAGKLDPAGAWQDPPRPNGIWTIRRSYLTAFAADHGWTVRVD